MLPKVPTVAPERLRPTRSLLIHAWMLEVVSICGALAILIAIIALLSLYDGRPNPQWAWGVTLNTVVAFGSVFFRIYLMVPVASCISQSKWTWFAQAKRPLYDAVRFDQASRSMWGSLTFLVSFHVRYVQMCNLHAHANQRAEHSRVWELSLV